jgi:ATP-dependent RNA helicase DOB1
VSQYAALLEQQEQYRAEMRAIVTQPRYALPFLQPGRLVSVLTQPPSLAPAGGVDGDGDLVGGSMPPPLHPP